MTRTTIVAAMVAALLAVWAPPAAAQEEPADAADAAAPVDGEDERPWARGVSKEEQRVALELFRQGNDLIKDSLFKSAVEKYRLALQHWDHPAIHYNLALALMSLDQPLEVYGHLEKAMAYGVAPLDSDKFDHAREYKAALDKELARVEIVCDEPGAVVTMDGTPLFTAPGTWDGRQRAGSHTIVANKQGFMTTEKTTALPAGELTQIKLELYRADEVRYARKWATWKPIVVVGAGVLVVAAGAVSHWQAGVSFDEYDQGIKDCGGCTPSPELADKNDRGDTLRTTAIISYVVGGAILATGATLVYINRARPYRPSSSEAAPPVSVVPLLGPHEGGVLATWTF